MPQRDPTTSADLPQPQTVLPEPPDRPYLLLEDLVNSPIEFTLSDFSDLPDDLPPVH